jgi:Histidine kinase-, DNA gyrase B-, and HSP90-like ATPase
MDALAPTDVIRMLSVSTVELHDVIDVLIKRFRENLNLTLQVACPHSSTSKVGDCFTLYSDKGVRLFGPSELGEHIRSLNGKISEDPIKIDLSHPDHLNIINAFLYVYPACNSGEVDRNFVHAVFLEVISKAIYRWRAIIRNEVIDIKLKNGNLGDFCRAMSHEVIPKHFFCEANSIFVLDKVSQELKMRASTGIESGLPIRDISFSLQEKSLICECFNERTPKIEYDDSGKLYKGKTAERVGNIYSRMFWPIRTRYRKQNRELSDYRNGCMGVLRIVNRKLISGQKVCDSKFRPFGIFDCFKAEYLSEILLMMIESFVDKAFDGFDSDIAYHGAATAAEGILRNLQMVTSLIYGGTEDDLFPMPPQLAVTKIGRLNGAESELYTSLNSSLAYGHDVLAQIERSIDQGASKSEVSSAVTDKLLADVILKAAKLIPWQSLARGYSKPPQNHINKLMDLEKPPPVRGGKGPLLNVFKNIFENSVKYQRHDPKLSIDVSIEFDITKSDFVTVKVRDKGIGVDEVDLKRIFVKGVRTVRARSRQVHGNGLGLAYCKRVLEAIGGRISAESHDDGLTIVVMLKCA